METNIVSQINQYRIKSRNNSKKTPYCINNGEERLGEIYSKCQAVDLLLNIFETFGPSISEDQKSDLYVKIFQNDDIPFIDQDELDFITAITAGKLNRLGEIEYEIVPDEYLTRKRGHTYYAIYAIHERVHKYRGFFNTRDTGISRMDYILKHTSQKMPLYHGAELMTQICRLKYDKT
jgi:hypothetical protein